MNVIQKETYFDGKKGLMPPEIFGEQFILPNGPLDVQTESSTNM